MHEALFGCLCSGEDQEISQALIELTFTTPFAAQHQLSLITVRITSQSMSPISAPRSGSATQIERESTAARFLGAGW